MCTVRRSCQAGTRSMSAVRRSSCQAGTRGMSAVRRSSCEAGAMAGAISGASRIAVRANSVSIDARVKLVRHPEE